MEINKIQKYELLKGHLIVDRNFCVLAANEEVYRFIGISAYEISLLDFIHQVDIDDFMDVCSHLNDGQQKDMVLRMRRSDNSYRWMLINIAAFTLKSGDDSLEYFEINASDVIALRNQNTSLHNSLLNMRNMLAMDNELFFTYDHCTRKYQISNFIDEEIRSIIDSDVDKLMEHLLSEKLISDETKDEFFAFAKDVQNGTPSFEHTFGTRLITRGTSYSTVMFKGNTIYKNDKPHMTVGSMKNLSCPNGFFNDVISGSATTAAKELSYDDIRSFCENSMQYNSKTDISLLLMEIDNFELLRAAKNDDYTNRIYQIFFSTIKQIVGYRGSVCEVGNGTVCIGIKNINSEVYIRAFIECLRDQIEWNIKLMDMQRTITFSIGVVRVPQNGNNTDVIYNKLIKALNIAHERGRDRFIIYKEHLHGEIE